LERGRGLAGWVVPTAVGGITQELTMGTADAGVALLKNICPSSAPSVGLLLGSELPSE